ncbi:MAG TPA: class I SAM-dependent methyltransferase [Acidobacteriaceae bacterium]|nr:class I SAM-dependent methyltransferase [Acidobacteriaceae bacterium]
MRATNFDRVASPYRWMEYASFGPYLDLCRLAQIEHLGGARSALLLGEGDGRFLEQLLAANPCLTADVVDSSSSMLRLLDRRIARMGPETRERIHLHHADALQWTPTATYDLVVSHFFLDCFFSHQIDEILDRLLPHVDPHARWLISEFSVLRRPPASYLSACIVGFLYQCFGLLTGLPVRRLPDYAACLEHRRFLLSRQESFLGGLLQSQIWSLPG